MISILLALLVIVAVASTLPSLVAVIFIAAFVASLWHHV
jgi:hypothetical protein